MNRLGEFVRRLDPKQRIRIFEDWWFDATRHVRTVGYAKPEAATIVGEIRDGYVHVPIRVANARDALRDLPIADLSDYTFIDMGSGKGRMLFIAAEYPFRKVMGVEFSTVLHPQAQKNIERYRHRKRRCGEIESICADAAEFEFPEEKLVLYLFNPFGPEVMGRMLANLERSIARCPRHVVVLMLWPDHGDLVAQMPGMQTYRKTRRHHIYQTGL
jgi:SAM-dependent methyltransferase